MDTQIGGLRVEKTVVQCEGVPNAPTSVMVSVGNACLMAIIRVGIALRVYFLTID